MNEVKEKKLQGRLLFLNMQKQSEGTGLFALEMWQFRRIMVKVYVSSINEIDLGLLPFCLPVFLHMKRKMW